MLQISQSSWGLVNIFKVTATCDAGRQPPFDLQSRADVQTSRACLSTAAALSQLGLQVVAHAPVSFEVHQKGPIILLQPPIQRLRSGATLQSSLCASVMLVEDGRHCVDLRTNDWQLHGSYDQFVLM